MKRNRLLTQSKLRFNRNKSGSTPKAFTLIELLASVSVLAVIGTAIFGVFLVTLRGSKKANLLAVVRQNGTSAMSQMVRSIRYAKSLDDPSSCVTPLTSTYITITSASDGEQTIYSCNYGGDAPITSNSASLVDGDVVIATSCSFACSQQNINSPPTITIQFTLNSKNPNSLVESNASIPFQSSVTLRNYTGR